AGRVGRALLLAGHAGGDRRSADGLPSRPVGAAAEDPAVVQDEYGGNPRGPPGGGCHRAPSVVAIMWLRASAHSVCSAARSERKPESMSRSPWAQVTTSRPPSVRSLPAMPLSRREP